MTKCFCVICTAPGPGAGGGMSIYLQFLDALKNSFEHEYHDEMWHVYIDDGMPAPLMPNVHYHVCSTRGVGRMWFDLVKFNQILKKEGLFPDVIFSLQNTSARCSMAKRHVIYYHQPLTLYKYIIGIFEKRAKTYYFYHYLYPLYIRLFLNKRTYVAVQTETIRNLFIKKFHCLSSQVGVFFPKIEKLEKISDDLWEFEDNTFNFIYPANPSPYKEHMTIAYTMKELYNENPIVAQKVRVHFTIKEGSLEKFEKFIKDNDMQANFVFHGIVSHSQLLSMLKESHGLLFPSVIETIGLPLLESASIGLPIIANDLDYAHEVLGNYNGANFVPVRNYTSWAKGILSLCNTIKRYSSYERQDADSWIQLLKIIREGV